MNRILSKLAVSEDAYHEIKSAIIAAGRTDLLLNDGAIAMDDIALVLKTETSGWERVYIKVNCAYRGPVFDTGKHRELEYSRIVGLSGLSMRNNYKIYWRFKGAAGMIEKGGSLIVENGMDITVQLSK